MVLHRLLLREILIPFLLALLVLSQLLVLVQVLQLNEVLFGSGFDAQSVLRLMANLAPHFAVTALPLAFLLAILLGVGRLADDNELTALAALGRSPAVLYAVPLVLSLALGAVTALLVTGAEPRGLRAIRLQINELVKRNVAGNLSPGTVHEQIPNLTVYVGASKGKPGAPRWDRVLMHDTRGDGTPMLLLARRGQVDSRGSDDLLRVELEDGELHRLQPDGAYSRARFGSATLVVDMLHFFRRTNSPGRAVDELEWGEIDKAVADARAANNQTMVRRILISREEKRAMPFACIFFALVGVPLAAASRGGRGRAYIATMAAYAGYFILMSLGSGMAETGKLPAVAGAWLPNAGLATAAALLYVRLRRGGPARGTR